MLVAEITIIWIYIISHLILLNNFNAHSSELTYINGDMTRDII
jgi:hypothetical protein